MSTVFVTGGAGYVGSHACKAFAKAGWRVVVYDNLSRGWRDAVRWGPLVEGDILDRPALDRAFAEHKPDLVAHFAAFAYVGESNEQPDLYYRNNCTGTLTLLEAMQAAGIGRFVFSSSCATYGVPVRQPIDETHPQWPINPYGWSKLVCERMIHDQCAAYGLAAAALRYFNAAGADRDGEIGERHEPETHAIPLAIEAAVTESGRFTINGGDLDTRDGTCVRDYIHVDDLARAHVLAGEWLAGRPGFHPFNLGTGTGTTVKELTDTVRRVSGHPFDVKVGPPRPGDPASLVAEAGKAEQLLGWRAECSDIEGIVKDALAWRLSQAARTL